MARKSDNRMYVVRGVYVLVAFLVGTIANGAVVALFGGFANFVMQAFTGSGLLGSAPGIIVYAVIQVVGLLAHLYVNGYTLSWLMNR